MVITAIRLDSKQKQHLARRARETGSTLSQELRNAVDLYLNISVSEQEQLEVSARAANESAGRMIEKLDKTIAYTNRALRSMRKRNRSGAR
jgi:hypothetical protein